MNEKIRINNIEYELDKLSDQSKKNVSALQFIEKKLKELRETEDLFNEARKSFIKSLKSEMLSAKSGMLFEEE